MRLHLHIALPVPIDKNFTYLLPEGFESDGLVGRRALVPFGSRAITGVIVSTEENENTEKLKYIIEILDGQPAFSEKMLDFTKWIADYYICSWGEVLKAALPQGMSPKRVVRIKVIKTLSDDEILDLSMKAPKRAQLLAEINERDDFISVNYLEKLLETDSITSQISILQEQGIIQCEYSIEGEAKIKKQKALKIPDSIINDEDILQSILYELDKKSNKQSVLFSHIYLNQVDSDSQVLLSEALTETNTTISIANSLEKKNYIEIYETEVDRNNTNTQHESLGTRNESLLELTTEQQKALDTISDSLDKNKFKSFLLHGVTGSGKTLVYLHLIKQVVQSGKSALILVPEIALTPQLIDRFKNALEENFAVLHSRMSDGERFDAWRSIRNGEVKIILGARSAIFAPVENLGIIIVDEEHEPSYKQTSPTPRYNARDLAVVRASKENCTVILGSATPSIESMYNARTGRYELLEIISRADGAKLPEINAVNTVESRKHGQMIGSVSKILLDEISSRVIKKEGVILFQNRRGYAAFLECPDCGFIPVCKNCDVSLTYHKSKNQLRCHYCGFSMPSTVSCPSCGYSELNEVGHGTQRIEDELSSYLTGCDIPTVIERMDLDTTAKKGSHRKMLTKFSNGETDILIGTQMVAKGLDFARVTLVGVINADLQLYQPDFRATERTYQLLTQVAGRAGRSSELPGSVIIQTAHPQSHAVYSARIASYSNFYVEELNHRRNALYPPFARFSIIEFSSKNEDMVKEHVFKFLYLLPFKAPFWKVLGPVQPTIYKLRNDFRRMLIIKSLKEQDKNGAKMRKAIKTALEDYRRNYAKQSVKLIIDIDSYSGI